MFFWFVGLGFLAVVLVFRSPALDYRVVILGLLVPLVDVVSPAPPVLHTLLAPVVVMGLVMLTTRRRRLVRRRWLGLPIGMFMHLALDGAWTNTELFWWPAFGVDVPDVALPTFGRGPAAIVMEAVGVGVLAWSFQRFGLDDQQRRDDFWRQGRLDRDLVGG